MPFIDPDLPRQFSYYEFGGHGQDLKSLTMPARPASICTFDSSICTMYCGFKIALVNDRTINLWPLNILFEKLWFEIRFTNTYTKYLVILKYRIGPWDL